MSNDFDVVIIGSGIAGITCGALLAKKGLRVAILEKHSQAGGCCQSFCRNEYRFDSCVHSVSLAKDGFIESILNQLGIHKELDIISNSCVARIISPQLDYTLPSNLPELKEKLLNDFSDEKDKINKIITDMQNLFSIYKGNLLEISGKKLEIFDKKLLTLSTTSYKKYIEGFLTNTKLRFLFESIWPFGGITAEYAPIYQALIFITYAKEGSHYISGGFSKLVSALCNIISSNNGIIRLNWNVEKLRVERNKKIKSVINNRGEEITGNIFISNISPYTLYNKIVPLEARNRLWQKRLLALTPSVSAVCVYIGLNCDASQIIPDNINFWFDDKNHDEIFKKIVNKINIPLSHLLIIRPPSQNNNIISLIYFVKQDLNINWTKDKILVGDLMIKKLEELFGKISQNIKVVEYASPKTIEYYTGNTFGACYGFESTKDLYGQTKLPFVSYFDNLYHAGHWTKAGGGVYNAITSAYIVSNNICKMEGNL